MRSIIPASIRRAGRPQPSPAAPKMDRFIQGYSAIYDGDLRLCITKGVAYQADMTVTASYDEAYFAKYKSYEGTEIAEAINSGRVAMVNKYVSPDAGILDIGCGSCEFIKARPNTFGFDINPAAVGWLKEHKRFSDTFGTFDGFTFWDVIEHVPVPEDYFRRIHDGAYVFVSIPVFSDLTKIRESKHYRPGEHLIYFSEKGFTDWMAEHGFQHLETQDFETAAGRDSILSFAFRKGA